MTTLIWLLIGICAGWAFMRILRGKQDEEY